MLTDAEPQIETRALALTSLALAFSTVSLLAKTKRISKPEADDLFQGVLEVLESFPADIDPAVQVARQLVDAMAQVVATGGTFAPKADRT
jgi:hypothetical protein